MRSPFEIDTSVAHAARVHNYLAGGRGHFAADREAIEYAADVLPGGMQSVRGAVRSMRSFMRKATSYLVQEVGVRQFLELGTAVPTGEDLHEIVQRADPRARVVYVGNDPVVLAHAHALLRSHPHGAVTYIDGTITEPDEVIWKAASTLNLAEPVAVLVPDTMSFVPEERDPYGIMTRLFEYLAPGSCLALAHATDENDEVREAAARFGERLGQPYTVRSRARIASFFDGLDFVGSGLVPVEQWPHGLPHEQPDVLVPLYAGVGRKPLRHAARGNAADAELRTDAIRQTEANDQTDREDQTAPGDLTDKAGPRHQTGAADAHDSSEGRRTWSASLSRWASIATIVATALSILGVVGLWGREARNDQGQTPPTSLGPSSSNGAGLPTFPPPFTTVTAPAGVPAATPTEIIVTPDLGRTRETVEVMISGRGFEPNERIRVEISSMEGACPPMACTPLKDVHADAAGSFDSVWMLVPLNFPGGQTVFVTARGMTSQRTASQPFVVVASS